MSQPVTPAARNLRQENLEFKFSLDIENLRQSSIYKGASWGGCLFHFETGSPYVDQVGLKLSDLSDSNGV